MLQLSEKMPISVPSVEKDWRYRGEYYALTRQRILLIRVSQRSATKETLSKRNRRKNLLAKDVKKAHTLCAYT